MSDFLAEVRRLEWAFTEGLWAPAILAHTNTRYDFAGVNYAPFDDMLNGYTVQFTGVATRVDLLGSNNDIIDVLIPTGVSVVPSNSAGLQIVAVGSGVTAQDKADIINGVLDGDLSAHQVAGTLSKTITDILAASGMTTEQATQLLELYMMMGLKSGSPMTVTQTSKSAGPISQTITGDPEVTITLERDP